MRTEVETELTQDDVSIGMVTFNENGTIDFPVVPPLTAPDMRPDQRIVDRLLLAVEEVLKTIEVQSHCKPSLCFRPTADGFELYRIRAVIPGTISLRTGRGVWKKRKKPA